jgi:hypothetical protein
MSCFQGIQIWNGIFSLFQNLWRVGESSNNKSCSKLYLLSPRNFLDFNSLSSYFPPHQKLILGFIFKCGKPFTWDPPVSVNVAWLLAPIGWVGRCCPIAILLHIKATEHRRCCPKPPAPLRLGESSPHNHFASPGRPPQPLLLPPPPPRRLSQHHPLKRLCRRRLLCLVSRRHVILDLPCSPLHSLQNRLWRTASSLSLSLSLTDSRWPEPSPTAAFTVYPNPSTGETPSCPSLAPPITTPLHQSSHRRSAAFPLSSTASAASAASPPSRAHQHLGHHEVPAQCCRGPYYPLRVGLPRIRPSGLVHCFSNFE